MAIQGRDPNVTSPIGGYQDIRARKIDAETGELIVGSSVDYARSVTADGTAVKSAKTTAGRVCKIINTGAAQTNGFAVYDSATAAAGPILWSGTLSAGQVVDLQVVAKNGIAYAALTAGVGADVLVTLS